MLQAAGLAAEDPTTGYMLQAGARLCKCLREEFLPYLQVVMPPLLASAQLRPDVAVLNESDEEDDDEEVLLFYICPLAMPAEAPGAREWYQQWLDVMWRMCGQSPLPSTNTEAVSGLNAADTEATLCCNLGD